MTGTEKTNESPDGPSDLNDGLGRMTFGEAIERLGIPEYGERIFHSNSHGELFHLLDYIEIAQLDDVSWFKEWFQKVVEYANDNWQRPESIFQHILTILQQKNDYS